ncbi:phosphoribosylanthranilate isomerase [Pararhizobium mangrovi]|uniref:N-(5'-phosphoribosyl)anthranilate isomerase n=1 Tax=Pararhizobium mangrovi TaxID=2590452 RepID=A0A506U974_9HYPH|nr:phosphoribosylanthranilate isomerase [Pararhizobium mangrovi]TPW28387.1 phosphoribosylanthranilate isomerase [Pararhizobium mangrovi]
MRDAPDIKICGLTSEDAVTAVLGGGASHLGFIFFARSPRHVTPERAGTLAAPARGRALVTAVTVDAEDDELDRIVAALEPDWLQLHGRERPERVHTVRTRYGLPVMKSFSIRTAADLAAIEAYADVADRLLFDAKPPAGAELPGGNGVSFDWRLLSVLDADVDYMLSGGLDSGNVGEALRLTGARGIDASSGVESAPGTKDPARIAAFFEAVRAARGEPLSGARPT